ncbi:MAG: RDD family protein [Aquihabitans sp.]
MTAFGGALTDPTKIMGSRVAAFVIDLVLAWAVLVGAFFLFGIHNFEEVRAGSPEGAEQICRDVDEASGGNTQKGLCFASGSTAHVATGDDIDTLQGQFWGVVIVVGFLNYVLLTVIAGGTVGKLIFGLRVVTARGQRAGFGRNIARSLLLFVDAACCYVLPGLAVALNAKGHRRIGDLAAGTYVVHRSAEGRLLHIPGHLHVQNRHEYGSFGPAPVGVEPTLGTSGGIDAPVFDPSRNTYVRYDQGSGVWFQWDDATQAWVPAQQ